MNLRSFPVCFICLVSLLTCISSSQAQDQALQKLIHGKKFFWEARFEQALGVLREVTALSDAKPAYLFEAYLYTGFTLLRLNAPQSEAISAFTKAIKIDPKRMLDEMVIPPDLAEPFYRVRNQMVGCLHVITYPGGAEIFGVKGDSVLFEEKTPVTICDVEALEYQLLFTAVGYQQQFEPMKIVAGRTDTLEVFLRPLQGHGGKRSALKWAIPGGLAVGAAAAVYTFVGGSDEPVNALPTPPDHLNQ